LLSFVSEGFSTARKPGLEVAAVARKNAVVGVGSGVVMVFKWIIRVGRRVYLTTWF